MKAKKPPAEDLKEKNQAEDEDDELELEEDDEKPVLVEENDKSYLVYKEANEVIERRNFKHVGIWDEENNKIIFNKE